MTTPTPRTMQSCAVWLDGEDGERILAVPLDTAELFLAARDAELAAMEERTESERNRLIAANEHWHVRVTQEVAFRQEAEQRAEAAERDAFTMAAGQCIVKSGGLMADDHGHQYCDMERQRDEWKRKAEEAARDVLRYRYLRSRDKDTVFDNEGVKAGVWIDRTDEDGTLVLLTFDDADAAIDAAIAGEPS